MRVAIDLGYSYRNAPPTKTVKENPYLKEIVDNLRSGVTYSFEVHRTFKSGLGLGGKFQGFHYASSSHVIEDRVNNIYFAPSLLYRRFDKRGKNACILAMTMGYLNYNEKFKPSTNNWTKISRGAFASSYEIGYDIKLDDHIFFGFKFSMFVGNPKIQVNRETVRESQNSINITAGLRF